MRVAAIQLSSQAELGQNLEQAAELAAAAARNGARLLCFPEGFAYLGSEAGRSSHAECLTAPGPILRAAGDWCRAHAVWSLLGGMPEISSEPARAYNTSVLCSPSGEVTAAYRKMHLFDVHLDDGTSATESSGSLAGDAPVVADVEDLRVGLSICYDVRFPRLYEAERELGANLLTVPAAFTSTTGAAHWHVLLRARAIETQCWVVAAAQVGEHPQGRRTFGHSLIVDPWGRIVAELPSGVGFVSAEVQADSALNVRRQMPIWAHRRLV